MRSVRVLVVFGLVMAFALSSFVSMGARGQSEGGWFAILSGQEEVPARDTLARGSAFFMMVDEDTVAYTLIVANIRNVFAAHIHCGAFGVNGPVGVTLFMGTPGGGSFNGILAAASFTAPDAAAAQACGWETLDDVIAAMNSGNTYVNVHTNDGVAPPNTGAGDFPGGEIRGQVMVAGS